MRVSKRILLALACVLVGLLAIACNPTTTYTVTVNGVAQTVKEGALAVAPADPTLDKHEFDGWVANGVAWSWDTPITEDVVITPVFTRVYTVTVDGVAQTVRQDEFAIPPETDPTLENHEFDGWVVDGAEWYWDTPIMEDIAIEPVFTRLYTVTVGGVEQTVREGACAVAPTEEPVLAGNRFIGWLADGEEWTFTTPVTADLTVTPSFEAEGLQSLAGGFFNDNGLLTAKQDMSIALYENYSLRDGSFDVVMQGAGEKRVIFALTNDEIKRGRPTGDYYALTVSKDGLLTVSRAVKGVETIQQVSVAIQDTFSTEMFYRFTVQKSGGAVSIYYSGTKILGLSDSLPSTGYGLALSAGQQGAILAVSSVSINSTCDVVDGTLCWSDSEQAGSYFVAINGAQYQVTDYSLDLDALGLPVGVYNGVVYKNGQYGSTELHSFRYGVRTQATDVTNYNGEMMLYGGEDYYTNERYTLSLFDGVEFSEGTVSVEVTPGVANDCGLVFRVDTNGADAFWEDKPAQYYCALININGYILLGKVNYNGATWTCPAWTLMSGFNPTRTYLLTVKLSEDRIQVLVDGDLYLDYTDPNPLTGTGIGYRAAAIGTRFSGMNITAPVVTGFGTTLRNQAVELGGELDLANIEAFITYDNGARELLTITRDMLSAVDTSTAGKKTLTISYNDGQTVHTSTETVWVETDAIYYMDFAADADSSALPYGWGIQAGSISSASVAMTQNSMRFTSTTSNYPVGLVNSMLADLVDYEVEMEFSVAGRMDDGRWLGIGVRNGKKGWWKGSVGLNGAVSINTPGANLGKPAWTQAVIGAKGFTIANGDKHKVKVTMQGRLVTLYYDGEECIYHVLPEEYTDGSFAIVMSGVVLDVHSISVKKPSASLSVPTAQTYYTADFSAATGAASSLPTGWTWKCESTKPTYKTTTEGIELKSLDSLNVVSLQYTDSAFTQSNYTVEMTVKVADFQNTGRWFGVTTRGTSAHGYIRTHTTIAGNTGGSAQTKWNIGNGNGNVANVNLNTATNMNATFTNLPAAIEKGDLVRFRVTAWNNRLIYEINDMIAYVGYYTDNYLTGTFGFTMGGGHYVIQSVTARSVTAADLGLVA